MERGGMSAIPDRSVPMGAAGASDRRYDCLDDAARLARHYLAGLPDRPVGATAGLEQLRAVLARPLPDRGEDPRAVIEDLARDVDTGLVASGGPRYFGFVIGGAVPAAVASDWLVSAWDQNAAGFPASPALSVVEQVAATWIREVLGVPASSGSWVRHRLPDGKLHLPGRRSARRPARGRLGRRGAWTARRAPGPRTGRRVRSRHHRGRLPAPRTGPTPLDVVPADDQGRMRPDALREALATDDGPTIVCAQAGEVHTGRVRPVRRHRPRAAASAGRGCTSTVPSDCGPRAQSPAARVADRCRSRPTPGPPTAHKWLNVPYDCGIALVADPDVHRAAMTLDGRLHPPRTPTTYRVASTGHRSSRAGTRGHRPCGAAPTRSPRTGRPRRPSAAITPRSSPNASPPSRASTS